MPVFAPGLVAFFAAFVRGMSGFGDGVTFQAVWSLGAAFGLLPGPHSPSACWSMRKSVLYSTIMQCLTMPVQAWQAREYLVMISGYTVPMALAGSGFVVLGALLLLSSSTAVLRPLIGATFLVFSLSQFGQKARAHLRHLAAPAAPAPAAHVPSSTGAAAAAATRRAALSGQGEEEEAEGEEEGGVGEEGKGLVLHAARRDSTAWEAHTPAPPSPASAAAAAAAAAAAEAASAMAVKVSTWVPPLPTRQELAAWEAAAASARGHGNGGGGAAAQAAAALGSPPSPPHRTLLLLLCRRSPSSPSSPSSSTSSTSSYLEALPRLSRHFSPLGTLALLLPAAVAGGLLGGLMGAGGPPLMAAYALLEMDKDVLRGFGIVPSVFMLVRLGMYTGSEGGVFDWGGEAGVYALILVGSTAGVGVGTWARRWVSAEGIVLVILALVFLASGLLLDLFNSGLTNALFGAIVGGGGGGFLWLRHRALLQGRSAGAPAAAATA